MNKELLEYFKGDELAASTWQNKYALKHFDGVTETILEKTPDEMHKRMAEEFAKVLKDKYRKSDIEGLFADFRYVIPGGSVMASLGSNTVNSLSNCFVVGSPQDNYSSIMKTRTQQVHLMKRRGGVGYDLSNLRPAGSPVNNAARTSTGLHSFMEVCSSITKEVAQDGRRGALMLSTDIRHPDSLAFIEMKQDLTKVTGANVSVKVPDDFMKAVEADEDYILRYPVDTKISLDYYDGFEEYNKLYKNPYVNGYIKRIRAKELWDKLIHCAWNTAEPGILFIDRIHNYSPDGGYEEAKAISTNPCFTGDMELLTNAGNIRLDKLVGVEGLLAYNSDNKLVDCVVQPTKIVNKYVILKFQNNNGKISNIKCTSDHKFPTYKLPESCFGELDFIEDVEAKNLFGKYVRLNKWSKLPGLKYLTCIGIELIKEDIQVVYDFTLGGDNHYGWINGVLAHNCGEIPLGPFDSCRLMHINFTSFVVEPFTKNAYIDLVDLYKVAYSTLILADSLVDLEIEAVDKIIAKAIKDKDDIEREVWEKINETSKKYRRVGVGFTGLADTIAMLGLRYGSDESLSVIESIMRMKMKAELRASVHLASSKGPFPGYHLELEKDTEWDKFVASEYPCIYEQMCQYGRRNLSFSTVAPTGSVSIMAQVSSGIEPVFMPYYMRRRKVSNDTDRVDFVDNNGEKFTEFIVVHPMFKKWVIQTEFNIPPHVKDVEKYINDNWSIENWKEAFEVSPWYGSTSPEIPWNERVKIQEVVQKYTTHAISSTVNLPETVTPEEINNIYMNAWKYGLKGITVYRDNCRQGILNNIDTLNKPKSEEGRQAAKRPKVLEADYYQVKSKGVSYIVLVGLLNNKPYEVFTFQPTMPVDIKPHKGKIIKIKKGQYAYDSEFIKIDNLHLSTTNIEERSCSLYTSMLLRHGANINFIIKTAKKVNENISSFSSAMCRVLAKYTENEEIKGEKCPQCGGKLIRESGCVKCLDCDYSKCL